jgi:hypothetical protein
MRHSILRAVVVLLVLAVGATFASRGASAPAPNIIGMSQLDVGYRLGEGALKIRATLATGEAIEYSTYEPREVQTILAVAQACGPAAAMSAVVEDRSMSERSLRAIQCSIRPGFGVARP